MTQEEKELLLKDLCARLLYGVMCRISDDNEFPQDKTIDGELTPDGYKAFADTMNCSAVSPFFVKPYLRSLSNMTEEERTEYFLLKHRDNDRDDNIILVDEASALIDWLNSHHFDYRGLIEKGLALEAPEGMYND